VNEWIPSFIFPDKIIGYLRTKCHEKNIFALDHQGHCILKPWGVFFKLALPFHLGTSYDDKDLIDGKYKCLDPAKLEAILGT